MAENMLIKLLRARENATRSLLGLGIASTRQNDTLGMFSNFGGNKALKFAQGARFLHPERLISGNISKAGSFAKNLADQFNAGMNLLHIKPNKGIEQPMYSEMDPFHVREERASAPAQPSAGELRAGMTIPSMSPFPKPGQSFDEFKRDVDARKQTSTTPRVERPARPPAAKPPEKAAGSVGQAGRIFSRVQEMPAVPLKQAPLEAMPEAIEPLRDVEPDNPVNAPVDEAREPEASVAKFESLAAPSESAIEANKAAPISEKSPKVDSKPTAKAVPKVSPSAAKGPSVSKIQRQVDVPTFEAKPVVPQTKKQESVIGEEDQKPILPPKAVLEPRSEAAAIGKSTPAVEPYEPKAAAKAVERSALVKPTELPKAKAVEPISRMTPVIGMARDAVSSAPKAARQEAAKPADALIKQTGTESLVEKPVEPPQGMSVSKQFKDDKPQDTMTEAPLPSSMPAEKFKLAEANRGQYNELNDDQQQRALRQTRSSSPNLTALPADKARTRSEKVELAKALPTPRKGEMGSTAPSQPNANKMESAAFAPVQMPLTSPASLKFPASPAAAMSAPQTSATVQRQPSEPTQKIVPQPLEPNRTPEPAKYQEQPVPPALSVTERVSPRSRSAPVVQRMWEEHSELSSSAGSNGAKSGEGGGSPENNLELLAEQVLPLVKHLLQIEIERAGRR